MYRKILVPVDGSDASNRGLQEAIALARSSGGTIGLVHVVHEVLMPATDPAVYSAELADTPREAGRAVLQAAQKTLGEAGIQNDAVLLEATGWNAAELIVRHARDWDADVIVMGTHGRRGVRRLVMGSDAENVVRSALVPVLLVRAPPE